MYANGPSELPMHASGGSPVKKLPSHAPGGTPVKKICHCQGQKDCPCHEWEIPVPEGQSRHPRSLLLLARLPQWRCYTPHEIAGPSYDTWPRAGERGGGGGGLYASLPQDWALKSSPPTAPQMHLALQDLLNMPFSFGVVYCGMSCGGPQLSRKPGHM